MLRRYFGCVVDEPLPAAEPLAPPAAEPDFFSSSGAVVADEEEEDEPAGDEGVAVEPVEPEPDIEPEPEAAPDEEGEEGFVAVEPELEVEPAPEGEVVVSPALSPQAVRTLAPNARETAIARVESLMCPPWLGYRCKSKERAR